MQEGWTPRFGRDSGMLLLKGKLSWTNPKEKVCTILSKKYEENHKVQCNCLDTKVSQHKGIKISVHFSRYLLYLSLDPPTAFLLFHCTQILATTTVTSSVLPRSCAWVAKSPAISSSPLPLFLARNAPTSSFSNPPPPPLSLLAKRPSELSTR